MRDGATCSLRARHINFDCAVTHMGICSWSHRHALPVVAAAQAAWECLTWPSVTMQVLTVHFRSVSQD